MLSDSSSNLSMTVAIAVALTESTLFPREGCTATKKLRRMLENGGNGVRINALLDSMRASSPTRARSLDTKDLNYWLKHHPSALRMFDDITRASQGKNVVVFLDYDGTLSSIVDDPDRAFITPEMRETVRDVAKYFPTAIVSGRCRAKVYNFVRLSELYYAGSHGMDIKGPAEGSEQRQQMCDPIICQPAREFLPMIDEVYKVLMEKMKHIPGAIVENNKYCLSIHYRCVEEKKWGELAKKVKHVIKDYPQLRLTQGRKVLEVRPMIKWNKGDALEFLLDSLGYGESNDVFPVYIGDDRTDEDAFKVLRERGHGLGILVSKAPKETNATYSLQEPTEVMQFLKRLVEWKKLFIPRLY